MCAQLKGSPNSGAVSRVRLRNEERELLLQTLRKLDPEARLFLYGSRTLPEARGGDIDLVIESRRLSTSDLWQIRSPFWQAFGEQKIDIVLHDPEDEPSAFLRHISPQLVELS